MWEPDIASSTSPPIFLWERRLISKVGLLVKVAVGGNREFAGFLGTQVVKVFDLAIARTGLREKEAEQAEFDALTVEIDAWDHKAYHLGAQNWRIRLTGKRQSDRLLGAQMVGLLSLRGRQTH